MMKESEWAVLLERFGESGYQQTIELQRLKGKVDVLEEQAHKFCKLYRLQEDTCTFTSFRRCNKIEDYFTIEQLKYFETHIYECLPILLIEKEERKTAWKLLKIIEDETFSSNFINLPDTLRFLGTFAGKYENCASVEKYATDETGDLEMHTRALKAREIVGSYYDIFIQKKIPKPETEKKIQQRFLYDAYYQRTKFDLTKGVHFYETVILTDKSVTVGWKSLKTKIGDHLETVNEEKILWQVFDLSCNGHFIGFHGSFPIGTVLTCLLDISQQTVAFYIDGRPVDCKKKVTLVSGTCKVAAYVDNDEEYSPFLYVNFGQVLFKHLPGQFDNSVTGLGKELLRRTANQFKVYLLKESTWTDMFFEKTFSTIEEVNCFKENIFACLPLLGIVMEEQKTVWKLLKILYKIATEFNDFLKIELPETYQLLLACLNRFSDEHEDWSEVEEYAMKKTVDWKIQRMAVAARKGACHLEGKKFDIESGMKKKVECETKEKGKCAIPKGNYRSARGLTSGMHFYETVVLTKKKVNFGWKTRTKEFPQAESINEEELIWQSFDPIDEQHQLGFSEATFPLGTVLGCLLDFTQRAFAFYVNGQQVQLNDSVAFSSNPYYVVAGFEYLDNNYEDDVSLDYLLNLLYFNFGQVPFKYPPPQLNNRLPAMVIQANRYALYGCRNGAYSIPLFDNQVEPCFTDEKQKKVKARMGFLLKKGEIRQETIVEEYGNLWREEHFRSETYFLRWLQEMIEMSIEVETMRDWARLVEMVVEMTIEKWGAWQVTDFVAFIGPYTKLRVTEGALSMYRNLTILFATSVHYFAHFYIKMDLPFITSIPAFFSYSRLSSAMSSFLEAAFLTSHDPIIAMFALIGLQTVDEEKKEILKSEQFERKVMQTVDEEEKEKLKSEPFVRKLMQWKERIEKIKNKTTKNAWKIGNANPESHLYTQLQLVIQHFEHSPDSSSFLSLATSTSLSLIDSFSEIKISVDRLSLRSDWQWQSARSHLAIHNSPYLSLESPLFFFEVTLHTSGPMRIGWATQRWQVPKGELGVDENSIGYDGYNRCLWHQGVQLRVRQTHQWKAGDVISCLLDLDSKQFAFYHNGTIIETTGDIYSAVSKKMEPTLLEKVHTVYEKTDSFQSLETYISRQPYYAALSLGPYQQATVNFGHTYFQFPPKCLDFWDFQMYSEHLELYRPKKHVKLEHVTLTNSILALDSSTITNRDVTISQVTTKGVSEDSISTNSMADNQNNQTRLSQSQNIENFAFQQMSNPHFHQMMARMPQLNQIPQQQYPAFYSQLDKITENFTYQPTQSPFPSLPPTIFTAPPAITNQQPFYPQPLPSISNAMNPQQFSNPQAQPVLPSTANQLTSNLTQFLPFIAPHLPTHPPPPSQSTFTSAIYPPGPGYSHFPPPYPLPYPQPYPPPYPSPYYYPTVPHPYSQVPYNPNHPNQAFSPNASIQSPSSIASTSQSVNVQPPVPPLPPIATPNYQPAYQQFYQPTVYYQNSSPFVPAPVSVLDPNVPSSQPPTECLPSSSSHPATDSTTM